MNERIEELADRANGPNPFFGPLKNHMVLLGDEAVEKFAELIVLECINKCDGNGEYKNHTDTEFGQGVAAGIKISKAQIQTHFGVKE